MKFFFAWKQLKSVCVAMAGDCAREVCVIGRPWYVVIVRMPAISSAATAPSARVLPLPKLVSIDLVDTHDHASIVYH